MEGTRFGQYELLELLGRGGMGEVYRARDTNTDRIIALKVLPVQMARDTVFQERFRREAQAASGVNDPHVVPIHGYGEIDGRLYLDMRLIEGENLGNLLAQRDTPLGPRLGAVVVEQVASALDSAHANGLVHRDVKPTNILISDREFVYLIDFGLARAAGEPGLTTAGSTLGTLAYMAPERFNSGQSDTRSDIYALTCVFYECLTGKRPYPSDSLEQQIAGHLMSTPPRPSDDDPSLAAFDAIIAKGMAKDPDDRYQTGRDLAVAVRAAVDEPRVRASRGRGRHSAGEPGSRSGSRRTAVLAALAAVLLAAGGLGVWQVLAHRGPGDQHPADAPVTLGAVPSIAATLPEDIRSRGRLIVGVNIPYAPNEFRDGYGQLVGFDVDLMNAVARVLGVTPEYREVDFDTILPSVQSGDFDIGMSSVTDTDERERLVDFVTYFEAGTLWAQRPGPPIDPAHACGLRVGVTTGVIQQTNELPHKSDACVAAGLPPIESVVFERQDDLTAALLAGHVDAMSADSPVTGFAIKTSGGALAPAGEIFDAGPYGYPVRRGSPLAESLRRALVHLMKSGEYKTIATLWGVERGTIDTPVINGAIR
ncbi:MAG: bifunctional serine/threonine-protein kinase/transporter substrate-binding domain-containing protein [Mycobacterium sp.]